MKMGIAKKCSAAVMFTYLCAGPVAADKQLCNEAWMGERLQEALVYCTRAAAQGDTEAQKILGLMYNYGEGVARDYEKAAIYYSQAARKGELISQYNLATLYINGTGVAQSDVTAFVWFTVAASTGWPLAVEARGRIGGRMTAWQISEGEARAQKCLSSGFTRC